MATIEFPQDTRVMGDVTTYICMPHAVVVAFCSLMTSLVALYFYTNSKRAVHGIIQPSKEACGTSCGEARAISSSLLVQWYWPVKLKSVDLTHGSWRRLKKSAKSVDYLFSKTS